MDLSPSRISCITFDIQDFAFQIRRPRIILKDYINVVTIIAIFTVKPKFY